jgi:uncharacterized membrane protein YhaH (DUF805 family)
VLCFAVNDAVSVHCGLVRRRDIGRCAVTEFAVVCSLAVTVRVWSVCRRRHHRFIKTGEPIVLAILTLVVSCRPSAGAVGSLLRNCAVLSRRLGF